MAMKDEHEFSMLCSNGHPGYRLVRLIHADDEPTFSCKECGAPCRVVDRCRAGERPLLKARLV